MTAALKTRCRPGADVPHLTVAGDTDPTIEYVDVTPSLAEEWLGKNVKNRNQKKQKVAAYSRAMSRGEWRMTAEPIKFDTAGNLLDGQNRLCAVIASGATVRMMVARGLAPDAQDVMDTGAARTIGDQMTIHGHANATVAGATASLLVLWHTGRFNTPKVDQSVSHAEALEFVAGDSTFAYAVSRASSLKKLIKARPSAVAAAYYLLLKVDAEDAEEFITRVADGATLPVGSPILALRHRLQSSADSRARLTQQMYCSLIIRAWNAWRAGQSIGQFPVFGRNGAVLCPEPK